MMGWDDQTRGRSAMGIRRNKTILEQAADYVDTVMEAATEKAGPAIAEAFDKAGPILSDAKDKAAPVISDAKDRYDNLETSYILQRLDSFDGLAVLATNLRQNIDAAFVRRMDFVIEFPLPDGASRLDLWKLHLPPERLSEGVDMATLARRYPVPGGWIRNAAIGAAFLAAPAGTAIEQYHLEAAMEREYGKAQRPPPGGPAALAGPVDARAERMLAGRGPAEPVGMAQEEER